MQIISTTTPSTTFENQISKKLFFATLKSEFENAKDCEYVFGFILETITQFIFIFTTKIYCLPHFANRQTFAKIPFTNFYIQIFNLIF